MKIRLRAQGRRSDRWEMDGDAEGVANRPCGVKAIGLGFRSGIQSGL